MWTEITRNDYERRCGRYASDMTDREWALLAPFMPARKRNGRPRTTDLRDVMDAILYMASTGCQWAMLLDQPAPGLSPAERFPSEHGIFHPAAIHLIEAASHCHYTSAARAGMMANRPDRWRGHSCLNRRDWHFRVSRLYLVLQYSVAAKPE